MYATTFHGNLSGNANTASNLEKSVQINGTNFNGSSGITTINWGATKNLNIGGRTYALGETAQTYGTGSSNALPALHVNAIVIH